MLGKRETKKSGTRKRFIVESVGARLKAPGSGWLMFKRLEGK